MDTIISSVVIRIISLVAGICVLYFLRKIWWEEPREYFGYFILSPFGGICWMALFFGDDTGIVGYGNIIILIGCALVQHIVVILMPKPKD